VYLFLRNRIPAVGVVVALLVLLGSTAASAARPAANDLASGTVPQANVGASAPDCAKNPPHVTTISKAAMAAAIANHRLSSSVCRVPSTAGVAAPNSVNQLVLCSVTSNDALIERSGSCKTQLLTYFLVAKLENGAEIVIATMNLAATSSVQLTGRAETWIDDLRLTFLGWSGDPIILQTSARYSAVCIQNCIPVRTPTDVSAPFSQGTPVVRDVATFSSITRGSPGLAVLSYSRWNFFFTNPGATPSIPMQFIGAPETQRCDNTLQGFEPGCVFSSVTPRPEIRSETNPAYARHIQFSHLSGLPRFLTRTTDPAIRAANSAAACPSSIPRNAETPCDEYPFASTLNGAASFASNPGGVNAARKTFLVITGGLTNPVVRINCGISSFIVPLRQPTGADNYGFSVCLIPKVQNESGGALLLNFYVENRVLDREGFFVQSF
jgi:hypothetical protein